MPYFTYILQSEKDESFYIGQTSDLVSRLRRHNAGLEKYTKNRGPWRLFWCKELPSRAEAMQLERKIKNMKSRKRILEFVGPAPAKQGEDARP